MSNVKLDFSVKFETMQHSVKSYDETEVYLNYQTTYRASQD